MSVDNYLIMHNFLVLCAKHHLEKKYDLLDIHETAIKQLLEHEGQIYPSNPVLHITKFDGVNTRNKVLILLQSNKDLDEVSAFKKKHTNFISKTENYIDSSKFTIHDKMKLLNFL
jgi:hypothetical protein